MGKPVAGEVVIIPFPQTDLVVGKRRPALVLVDPPGDDLILCQITSRARSDDPAIFGMGQAAFANAGTSL